MLKAVDAQYILRGIRSNNDYEYERVMRHINADMAPSITTTILMPPRDIAELSSSMVKSLIGPEGWEDSVRRYVPNAVFESLKNIASKRQNDHTIIITQCSTTKKSSNHY